MKTKNENIKQRQWNYLTDYLRENKITYKEYLNSEHWKDVRRRFWDSKLHNGRCQVCRATSNLQVHHKTYKRIGKERLNDLCLLCGNCHKEVHRIEKERPNGILFGAAKRLKKDFVKQETEKRLKRLKEIESVLLPQLNSLGKKLWLIYYHKKRNELMESILKRKANRKGLLAELELIDSSIKILEREQ